MAENRSHLRTITDPSGAVVLDIHRGTISILNETGRFIWEELERGLSEPSIVRRLAQETGESEDVVAADVNQFITRLSEEKLMIR